MGGGNSEVIGSRGASNALFWAMLFGSGGRGGGGSGWGGGGSSGGGGGFGGFGGGRLWWWWLKWQLVTKSLFNLKR